MEITKFSSQLFVALEQVTVYLRRAKNSFMRLGASVADTGRRLQEELRAREDDLLKLVASSPDAIVVTNVDRRFVAANPKALELFGVSQRNMRQFTIDAFLVDDHSRYFDGNGLPFVRREVRHGECRIRRLDGSLRLAEYYFVANFIPYRHMCRFRNDHKCS